MAYRYRCIKDRSSPNSDEKKFKEITNINTHRGISQYNRQFNAVYAIWQLTINQLLEGTSDTSYILYNMMIIVCCPVSGPCQYPATELNISALKCKFWRVCSLRNSCRRPRSAQWVNFSWLILTLLALFGISLKRLERIFFKISSHNLHNVYNNVWNVH